MGYANSSNTWFPNIYPAPTKTKFQTQMPRAELTVYFKKLNRSTPAGMEINVRTIGINLPRKIPMHPFCRIISKFRSIACCCLGNFFTYAFRNTLPPSLPKKYSTQLPTKPAETEITIVRKKLSFPFAAQIPATGMITPAGNPGRFIYSNNTITKIAITPYLSLIHI